MIRLLLVGGAAAVCACALPGCSGNGTSDADAGTDANFIQNVDPAIRVIGTAEILPLADTWLATVKKPAPTLSGLSLAIEDPLKASSGDPAAVLGTVSLDASGSFKVNNVATAGLVLGLASFVDDPAHHGDVVRSGTSLFDIGFQEGRPSVDLTGAKVFVLPSAFVDQLSQAISTPEILAMTHQTYDQLIEAGFILGLVVNSRGEPVSGAVIDTGDADRNNRFVYPAEDLFSASRAGTSANGLFVYVHDGTATGPTPFTFAVKDMPDYKARNGIAAPGVGLVVTVFPGTTPP
jgi:hypothetical protein